MPASSPKFNFNLPKNTRLGALTLLIVLIILVLLWRILPSIIQPKKDPEETALQQAWSKFERENVKETASSEHKYYSHSSEDNASEDDEAEVAVSLFPFNPNTATEAELLRLGLPKYTVNTILKYRAKSATTFKRKEDFAKALYLKQTRL